MWVDKPGSKGVMSGLGNVTATRESEEMQRVRGRGVEFCALWLLENSRISLVVVVAVVVPLQHQRAPRALPSV